MRKCVLLLAAAFLVAFAAKGYGRMDEAAGSATNKISPWITDHARRVAAIGAAAAVGAPVVPGGPVVRANAEGEIQVYAVLSDGAEARLDELAARGFRLELFSRARMTAQGWLPLSAIESVAALPWVERLAPPCYGFPRAGSVMTEGDAILLSDLARARGMTGAGVKVGVISTGIKNWAQASASGDLPAAISIYLTGNPNSGSGTSLLEIVHDIAPGAALAFSSGFTELEFLDSLNYLLNTARCDVIFDNVAFYEEPFFEDGSLAQTVAAAASQVVYISACGNSARLHYQGAYVDSNPGGSGGSNDWHAFAAGDTSLGISIPSNTYAFFFLQWSAPFGSSPDYDYQVYLYDASMTQVLAFGFGHPTVANAPWRGNWYLNASGSPINANIVIQRDSGAARTLELYLFGVTMNEYQVAADSIFGHAAAPGVLSVGAIHASDPGADTISPESSNGPLTLVSGSTRAVPRVTGIDGVTITGVGGNPVPYFGTSAAAAHAAGIAALLKGSEPWLTPAEIRARLEATAVDLGAAGYDHVFGFGRLNADAAIPEPPIPPAPTMAPEPDWTPGNENTVSWSGGDVATTFTAQASTAADFGAIVASVEVTSPTRQHAFGGLGDDTPYWYRVQARNRTGASDWSAPVSSIQDASAPQSAVTAPSGATHQTLLNVEWDAADPGANPAGVAVVAVYWSKDGGPDSTLGVFPATTTSAPFDVGEHAGYGTYRFYSQGCDNVGNIEAPPPAGFDVAIEVSPWPELTTPTLAPEPAWTRGLENTVYWTGGENATTFVLQQSADAEFATVIAAVELAAPASEHTFLGLTDDVAYWYRAAASHAGGATGWSAPVFSIQDAAPPQSAVTAPSGATSDTVLNVEWNASDPGANASGVAGVEIVWSKDGGPTTTLGLFAATTTSAPFDTTARGGGGTYRFYSVALDGVGNVEGPPPGGFDVEVEVAGVGVSVRELLDFLLGRAVLSPAQRLAADANKDGLIDIADLAALLAPNL